MKHLCAFYLQRMIASHLVIAAGAIANAQAFQVGDFIPPLGFPWRYTLVESVAPLDTTPGTNEVWNYESMEIYPGEGAATVAFLPDDVPYNSAFPSATLAIGPAIPTPNISYVFYGEQVNGLGLLGWADTSNGGRGFFFSDPELRFPNIDLGDTLIDPFCFGSVNSFVTPDTFYMCGSAVISFTSTGTLVLPYGTFPNARLLTSREYRWPQSAPDFIDVDLQQEWYIPGVTRPVLRSVYHWSDGEVQDDQFALVLSANTMTLLGVKDQTSASILTCFPNPATDRVTIVRGTIGRAEISIRTADGRLVMQEQLGAGVTRHEMDISSLVSGMYFVDLVTPSGRVSNKLLKQ